VGGQKKKFFSLLFFFWVVGCKKALKKSKIGLGLSHYFYYQPVIEYKKMVFYFLNFDFVIMWERSLSLKKQNFIPVILYKQIGLEINQR
jgi:hypothetical protein